ncbi:hypothetical protein PLICRDRAFT_179732 [Plicaturopsis crispa FD-325 SS-3]|uniref:F-box domain-containing protein n=1 Tax=Plicaturopsis crispa FD-325 SS-3 TaxID=944288 RepID=A0A0C9T7A0_PLICR|nr:hypothetical protein PLICRDRAFT_179732 [Plicaturopsis crispa FD-325 SS-3]
MHAHERNSDEQSMDSLPDHDIELTVVSLLPTELILKILDIAAASSRSTALALCTVSSWTHPFARRYLLDTVTLSTERAAEAFQSMLLHPGPHMAAVRHLWVSPDMDMGCVVAQLPNLAHLAINAATLSRTLSHLRLADAVSSAAARRTCDLCLTLIPSSVVEHYFDSMPRFPLAESYNERSPFLRSVTHLSLTFPTYNPLLGILLRRAVGFAHMFHRLTHLAIRVPQELQHDEMVLFCRRTLAYRPSTLQVLIIVVSASVRSKHTPADLAFLDSLSQRPPRVYVVDGPVGDTEETWLEEVRGVDSIWDRAIREYANAAP